MKLIIKYSLIKELKEAVNVLRNLNAYKNLSSFVKPSFKSIFTFAANKNTAIKHTQKIWLNANPEVEKAFNDLGVKDPGVMSCFLHGMSCDGWFDTDDNSIHVRFPENGGDEELLNTIVHEILHLATYDKRYDYNEREEIVDRYFTSPYLRSFSSKRHQKTT